MQGKPSKQANFKYVAFAVDPSLRFESNDSDFSGHVLSGLPKYGNFLTTMTYHTLLSRVDGVQLEVQTFKGIYHNVNTFVQ